MIDPPKRLALKWQNEWKPEMKAEGYSHLTMELEPMDGAVKLSIHHEMDRAESKFIQAVSGGWPSILSNLKSLLETGDVVLKTYAKKVDPVEATRVGERAQTVS